MFKNIHNLFVNGKEKTTNNKDNHKNPFNYILERLESEVSDIEKAACTEFELKLKDIIIFEAMIIMYMDIFDIEEMQDYRDPIALLSFHFNSIYADKEISFENTKVCNYAKLFAHIEENHLYDLLNSYMKAITTIGTRVLILNIERGKDSISISKKANISKYAKERLSLYEQLLNLSSDIFAPKINNKDIFLIDMKQSPSKPKSKTSFITKSDLQSGANREAATKEANIEKNTNKKLSSRDVSIKALTKYKLIINSNSYLNKNRRKDKHPIAIVNSKTQAEALEVHEKYFPSDNKEPQIRLVEEILESAINNKKRTPNKSVENDFLNPQYYKNVSEVHSAVASKIEFYKNLKNGKLLEITDTDNIDTSYILGDTFYYSGSTGSGKTITTEASIINSLLQDLNVLYISSNFKASADIFRFVNEVRIKKGYNFKVPFIMTGQDKEVHKINYIYDSINGMYGNHNNIISLYTSDFDKELLEQLDTSCLLDIPLGIGPDLKEEDDLPTGKYCDKLMYASNPGKKTKTCNLYGICGYYKRFEYMKNANLWITNLDALASSSMPEIFDTYKRTFLEVAIAWADIIIKDEADELQAKEESLALSEQTISDSVARESYEHHGRSVLDAVTTHESLIDKSNNSTSLNKLRANIPVATQLDKYVYQRLIDLDPKVFSKVINKFSLSKLNQTMLAEYSSLSNLFSNVKISYYKEKRLKEYLKKVFDSYIKESSNRIKILTYLNTLSEINLEYEMQEYMNEYISNEIKYAEDKINQEIKNNEIFSEFSNYNLDFKITRNEYSLSLFSLCQAFTLWDKVINKNIIPAIPSLVYTLIEQQSTQNTTLDNLSIAFTNLGKHKQYLPKPFVDINGYRVCENTNSNKKRLSIKKSLYEGDSRKLIKNANDFFANQYGIRRASIVYTSATSESEGSSLYNISDVDIDFVIRHKDQENQKVEFRIDVLLKGDKPLGASGIKDKEKALKDMVEQMTKENGLLDTLDKEHAKMDIEPGEATPITLIVTNSNPQAALVGQSLAETNLYSKKDIAVVAGVNESIDNTKPYQVVKTGDLATLYTKNVKNIVSSSMIIKRAHNILRGPNSQKSLIRNIIFMLRPYPSPDDELSLISLVRPKELREHNDELVKEFSAYKTYKKFIERCNKKLDFLINGGRWSDLDEKDKESIAINVLVDIIIQTAGRGRRGGTSVTIHLIDYALFNNIDVNELSIDRIKKDKHSMVYYWLKFLNNESEIYDKLYKELKEGLNNTEVHIHR